MSDIEKIVEEKSKKVVEMLMGRFDEYDIEFPEFKETARIMSVHEAEDILLYSERVKDSEFEDFRFCLGMNWLNKRELKKMKHQELLAYYIESLVGNLLQERYDVTYVM